MNAAAHHVVVTPAGRRERRMVDNPYDFADRPDLNSKPPQLMDV